jgi:VIT1/CCC1 family predicted Fe2+/Mn2+ transporter
LPIDPAEKRKVFERLSSVREIVFGVQDGVLTTAGVLCGLSGAVSDHKQVVLAALASTAAGALSMGAGAYLGAHAESEIVSAELEQARRESEEHPYVIQESLLEQLSKEGLSREHRRRKGLRACDQLAGNSGRRRYRDGYRVRRRCAGTAAPILFYRKWPARTHGSSGSHRNDSIHRRIF